MVQYEWLARRLASCPTVKENTFAAYRTSERKVISGRDDGLLRH